jgi:hypothetical protein
MEPNWSHFQQMTERAEEAEARSEAQQFLDSTVPTARRSNMETIPSPAPSATVDQSNRSGAVFQPDSSHPARSLSTSDPRNRLGFPSVLAALLRAPHDALTQSIQPTLGYPATVFHDQGILRTGDTGENGHSFTSFAGPVAAARLEDNGNQQLSIAHPMMPWQQPMAFQHLHMPGNVFATSHLDQPIGAVKEEQAAMLSAANPKDPISAVTPSLSNPSEQEGSYPQMRKGPRVRPKRALTAYNIFFKDQRAKILAERLEAEDALHTSYGTKRERRNRPHGKMGFEEMAKLIGKKWKEIIPEELSYYKSMAAADKKRFTDELALFTKEECDEREVTRVALEASVPEETKKLYFARENYK